MSEVFTAPVLQSVEKSLNIVDQARKDGKLGKPSQGESALSKAEENIKSHFVSQEIAKQNKLRQDLLNKGHIERTEMLAGEPVGRIRILASKLLESIHSIRDQDEGNLITKCQTRLRAESDSKYFRAKNEIRRDANYPTSKIIHYVVIGFIVLGETVLNGFFFSQGMEQGLLGGFVAAALITLVNVAAAFVVGSYCAPLKNHIEFSTKIFGWLTIMVYVIFLIWFCVAVGHYRSLIQVNEDAVEAARQIMDVMFSWELFSIEEFYGWLLVFFSLLIGVIATVKFYKADDPYPGYGQLDRTLKRVSEEYKQEKNSHRKKIDAAIHDSQEELFRLKKQTQDHVNRFSSSLKKSTQIIDGYTQYCESAQAVYGQAIQCYRKHNLEIRPTDPPGYFGNTERIEEHQIQALDVDQYQEDIGLLSDVEATLDELPKAFDDATVKLDEHRENSQSEFKNFIIQLERCAGNQL